VHTGFRYPHSSLNPSKGLNLTLCRLHFSLDSPSRRSASLHVGPFREMADMHIPPLVSQRAHAAGMHRPTTRPWCPLWPSTWIACVMLDNVIIGQSRRGGRQSIIVCVFNHAPVIRRLEKLGTIQLVHTASQYALLAAGRCR